MSSRFFLPPTITVDLTRRQALGRVLLGGCGLLVAACGQGVNPKLDPNEPAARQVGYVEDAGKADMQQYPTYAQGQTCANCSLVQKRYGPVRPCSLFPGKLVVAKGWCNAWSLRSFD